jgi:acetyl-CoA C-acetyltransferase
MPDAFIVSSLRTPFGSFGGSLADVEVTRLGGIVMKALVDQVKLEPAAVDEVIVGEVLTGGVGQGPARQAMLHAGLPDRVHALTINKLCGSGLKAIMLAAGSISLGDSELAIAGGMESMSSAPYFLAKARAGYRMGHGEFKDLMLSDGLQDPGSGKLMGELADLNAERHGITREEQDEYAIRSYRQAQQAVQAGRLDLEIVPVKKDPGQEDHLIRQDEEPFKADFEKMKKLRPAFRTHGSITAGNASTISDGAAMSLLASESALKRHALTPRARLVAYSTNSLAPELFPEAPICAIQDACDRAGIRLADIGLFEINEAFASVVILAMRELELDPEKVNVNGGAISLGHPIGASGSRLALTLIQEMQQRNVRYGIATLCIGGGEAVAVLFERV